VINWLLRCNYKEINRIGEFDLGMHDDDGVSTQPENPNTATWAFIVRHSLQNPCASHPPSIYLYGLSLSFSLSVSLNLCDMFSSILFFSLLERAYQEESIQKNLDRLLCFIVIFLCCCIFEIYPWLLLFDFKILKYWYIVLLMFSKRQHHKIQE